MQFARLTGFTIGLAALITLAAAALPAIEFKCALNMGNYELIPIPDLGIECRTDCVGIVNEDPILNLKCELREGHHHDVPHMCGQIRATSFKLFHHLGYDVLCDRFANTLIVQFLPSEGEIFPDY